MMDISFFMNQAKVLEPLGAITSGSQFLEPDGKIFTLGGYFELGSD